MGRSPSCSKEGLKRGAWTAYEDKILTEYIAVHGEGRWRTLPKRAGLQRCGKSCRLRWLNYLRPDIKRGNISPDEEELIIRLHKLLGNRWSLIAGRLPGRTDNEIKNYWNTNLGKKFQDGHQTSASHGKGASAPSKENNEHKSEASNCNMEVSTSPISNVVYTKAIKSTNFFVSPQQTSTVMLKESNNSELPLAKLTNLSATSMANAVESNVEGDGMLLSSGEETSLDMMVDPFNIMGEFSLTDILDSDFSDANHDFNHCKGSIYDPYLSAENSLVFSDDEALQDWTGSCNYFQTNVPTIKDQSFSSCLFFDGEWLAE